MASTVERPSERAPRGDSHRATWIAVAVLALGYASLANGGMTVPPMLLIAAYCVAIPLAILRFPSRSR